MYWSNLSVFSQTFSPTLFFFQDDKQSTLSRYWTMDRSLQRRLQKTNYQHIKRLCRDRGQLFEDADFPPSARSVYRSRKPPLYPITWLRPHVRKKIHMYILKNLMNKFCICQEYVANHKFSHRFFFLKKIIARSALAAAQKH